MKIPAEVMKAAKGLVDMFGPGFSYLGKKDGSDVYLFHLPADEETGFPFVFLYEEGKPVEKVTGTEALSIIASFGVE